MTADHVDRLTAPAFHRAIAHDKVVHAGQFDSVEVALRAHVRDVNLFQDQVVRGRVEAPAVVDVDPVGLLSPHGDVPQHQMRTVAQLPSHLAALEQRRPVWLRAFDDDRSLPSALQVHREHSRLIPAGRQADDRTRRGASQS